MVRAIGRPIPITDPVRVLKFICLLFVLCWMGTAAGAQSAARAMQRKDVAQALADKSLECLRRGEDALTEASKRAAYQEGAELARQAVATDDLNADAHFALFANEGRLMLLEGLSANPFNLMKASEELDRALEIDPNHADALAAKGGLYRQLPWLLGRDLDKAESYLSRAIQLNPNAVSARIELAQTYKEQGHPERGLPLLRDAAKIAERQGKYRQLAEARQLLSELEARE